MSMHIRACPTRLGGLLVDHARSSHVLDGEEFLCETDH